MIFEYEGRKPVMEGDYFVAGNAAVIGTVVLGPNANVWWSATIRGDNDVITLEENVNVQDGSVIHTDAGKPMVLARNVSVGHMAMLHGCNIGENTLIAIGAIVLDRVTVGKNCIIGAGALIPPGKTIPDGSLVIGSPGKVVRMLTAEEIAANTAVAKLYAERGARYRRGLKTVE